MNDLSEVSVIAYRCDPRRQADLCTWSGSLDPSRRQCHIPDYKWFIGNPVAGQPCGLEGTASAKLTACVIQLYSESEWLKCTVRVNGSSVSHGQDIAMQVCRVCIANAVVP